MAEARPVTLRAVIGRLDRVLQGEGKRLHKARGGIVLPSDFAGQYYIVHEYTNTIVDHSFGTPRLEYLARERGVLARWEELRGEKMGAARGAQRRYLHLKIITQPEFCQRREAPGFSL